MPDHVVTILRGLNECVANAGVKMRKDKLYAFGSLALFVWISMTYFLFVHKPNAEAVRRRLAHGLAMDDKKEISIALSSLSDRVDSFEVRLKRTSLENNQLLQSLKQAVKESQAKNEKKPSALDATNSENSNKFKDNNNDSHQMHKSAENVVIAVLMFACNRVTVSKALDSLLAYRKDKEKFPIIVSQDCGHGETSRVIKSYGDEIKYIQQPDQGEIVEIPRKERKFAGYFKIAR